MASALALQCSTSLSYEDPYTGGRSIYWVHQPVKEWNTYRMKWCELREYKWNEYVTIAVNRNLSNCEKARKKGFLGFNGIRARNPFFRAFSQLLKLRFTAMVTYSFHLYSRSSHHFKKVNINFNLWKKFPLDNRQPSKALKSVTVSGQNQQNVTVKATPPLRPSLYRKELKDWMKAQLTKVNSFLHLSG